MDAVILVSIYLSIKVSCGGTILNEDSILTASHCFGNGNQDPTHVHVGDTGIIESSYQIQTLLNFIVLIYDKNLHITLCLIFF